MKINIKAEPKEIATLVMALQERHMRKKDASLWLKEDANQQELCSCVQKGRKIYGA